MMLSFDLTGTDPLYKREGVQFRVFQVGQPLEFGEPVFADSITVVWVADGTGVETELLPGIQWEHTPSDIDWAARSAAALQDNTFDAVLVKSIRNKEFFSGSRTYVVSYQALQLAPSEYDYGTNGPTPNPGLMQELITTTRFLRDVQNPVKDITSDTLQSIRVLEEDLTGLSALNHVEDEIHVVNVPAGKQVVRPSLGSFYAHDVVVTVVATSTVLTAGVDYEIVGLNRAKTRIAEHTSGVYDYIFMLAPVVGELNVEYRAFGGTVSIYDINSIRDALISLTDRLLTGGYITETALGNAATVVSIVNRLGEVEETLNYHRKAMHTYAAPTDGKHWFTIAHLHRDQWDTQTLLDGSTHLGIKCYNRHWQYDVIASIGLRQAEPFKLKVLASADAVNQFDLNEYELVPERDVPELRIIWNESGGVYSGALVQLGMTMVHDEQEVIIVTSKSATDILLKANVIGDDVTESDNVTLPDESVWIEGDGNSHYHRALMCPVEGYLAWAGAMPLTEIMELDDPRPLSSIGKGDFVIDKIKKVTVFIYDRIRDRIIVKSNEHYYDPNNSISGSVFFFPDDLCSLYYTINPAGVGAHDYPSINLLADIGSHSIENERFDLRQIVLSF